MTAEDDDALQEKWRRQARDLVADLERAAERTTDPLILAILVSWMAELDRGPPETPAQRERRLAGTAGHRFVYSPGARRLYCCTQCGMRATELVLHAHNGVFPPCPGVRPAPAVPRDRPRAFHAHQFMRMGIAPVDGMPTPVRCMRCGLTGTMEGMLAGREALPACEVVIPPDA